jgi:general secretion pathway protein K
MPARPSRRSCFPRQPRRGSVILFVLGVILLTAFLLTRLIDRAGGELLAETKAASRTTLRDEAYSALEVTLAVLADASAVDNGLHAPQQGWDKPLEYAGYEPPAGFDIAVSFEDETGKLPVATVNEAVLQGYLVAVGATTAEAERLADALLAWMKADYLPGTSEADPRTYENAVIPYAPPHRSLHTFEELRAIAIARDLFFDADGQWSELGGKFCADASLQAFTHVNVNSARPPVLVALGIDPTRATAVAGELAPAADPNRAPKFYRTIAEAAAAQGADLAQAGLGADVQCLRVRVTVKQGARVFTLEAVVEPGNGAARGTTNSPAPNAPAANPDTSTEVNTAPATPVDPRATTSKSIDYPFRILELRETDGPAQ